MYPKVLRNSPLPRQSAFTTQAGRPPFISNKTSYNLQIRVNVARERVTQRVSPGKRRDWRPSQKSNKPGRRKKKLASRRSHEDVHKIGETRYGPNRPAADMEGIEEFDIW